MAYMPERYIGCTIDRMGIGRRHAVAILIAAGVRLIISLQDATGLIQKEVPAKHLVWLTKFGFLAGF